MTTIPLNAKQAKAVLARAHKFWRNTKTPGTTKRGITRSALDVLGVIVHLSKLGDCVPSIAYLSRRTSYSRATIIRCLHDLKACGLLHVQRRRQQTPQGSRQTSNRYTVRPHVEPRVPFGIELSAMFKRAPPTRVVSQGLSGAHDYNQDISIETVVRRYTPSLLASLKQKQR